KSLPDENVLTNLIRGSEGAGGQLSALFSFRAVPPKAIRKKSMVNAAVMAVRFIMDGPENLWSRKVGQAVSPCPNGFTDRRNRLSHLPAPADFKSFNGAAGLASGVSGSSNEADFFRIIGIPKQSETAAKSGRNNTGATCARHPESSRPDKVRPR